MSDTASNDPRPAASQHQGNRRDIMLPEGEYARYLANQAASQADDQVRKREARWHALLTGLFAVTALFGYWNLQAQRADLDKAMEGLKKRIARDIETAVRTELPRVTREYLRESGKDIMAEPLSAVRSELEAQTAYLQFIMLARKMSESTSFSDRERDSAIALLDRAISSPKIAESDELLIWIEKMIDVLSSARNIEVIDRIDKKFRDLIGKREEIVFTMFENYAHVVLGEAEVLPEAVERFRHYATMARMHKIRDLTNVFAPAYSFQQAGLKRNPVTDEQVRELRDLTARQKGDVIRRLDRYIIGHGDKGAFKRPLAYVLRIQKVFTSLAETYKAEYEDVRKTAEHR